ncbi:hypothetical protein MMC06_005570, partial [Schaereria dolodes]|nr:hypothetical protein [Schaereria dolodes]
NRSIRRPVLRTQSLSSIISLSPSHIPQRLSSLRSRLSSSSVSSTGSTSSVRLPRYLGSHRSAQAVLPLQRSISFGSFGELQSPAFQAYQYRTFSFVSANSPKRSSSLPIIREYRRTEQDRLYLDIDSIYNELHFPDRARQPQVYPGQSSTRQKIPIYVPMSFSGNRRSKMHTSKMAHQGSRDEQDRLIDSSRQQQEKKKKAQKKLAQKSLKSTTVPMRRVPNVNEPRPKTLWTKFKDLFTKKAK